MDWRNGNSLSPSGGGGEAAGAEAEDFALIGFEDVEAQAVEINIFARRRHVSGHAGWPRAAAVQTALDRRTHPRLARQLPTAGGALRPFAQDLLSVLSHRLIHDRLWEGCAAASS